MTSAKKLPDEFAAVTALGPERTVEQALTRELRLLITEGKLRPGVRLPYRELARQFGVSVTPVRIAVRELVKEGLIEVVPHGGGRVSPLSLEELEEIYATRTGLEGWLARLGAERMNDVGLNVLEARLLELEEFARARDREEYLHAIWSFRSTCYEAANRPQLLEKVSLLVRRSARYNWLAIGEDYRIEESFGFHRSFGEACRTHDGREAQEILRKALDRALDYVRQKYADELAQEASASDVPEIGPVSGLE